MPEYAWIFTIALGGVFAAFLAGLLTRSIKIAEFRQAWINELRKDISDYMGASEEWFRDWYEFNDLDHTEKTKALFDHNANLANKALVIFWRIELRFKPAVTVDTNLEEKLIAALNDLLDPGKHAGSNPLFEWRGHCDQAVDLSRELLKREWEVTKNPWNFWF